MPPVHPAMVHYPIALVTLSVIADLFGHLNNSGSLRAAGFWALVGAARVCALAVIAGLFDMNREKIEHEAHEHVHTHMRVGFALFAVIAGLTVWRWLIYINPHNRFGWGYLDRRDRGGSAGDMRRMPMKMPAGHGGMEKK